MRVMIFGGSLFLMCCSQLEAANFYWNKRSKKRISQVNLRYKSMFPQKPGKKKKPCSAIWMVQTVSFRLGELGILLHSSNSRSRFHNAFIFSHPHEDIKPLGQVANTIYFYPSKDWNYCPTNLSFASLTSLQISRSFDSQCIYLFLCAMEK